MRIEERSPRAIVRLGFLCCLLGTGLIWLACGSGSSGDSDGSSDDSTAGSVVVESSDGSAELTIPEGALPDGVSASEVSLVRDDSIIEMESNGEARVWVLEPDGLELSQPARLKLDVSIPEGRLLRIEHISESTSEALEPVLGESIVDPDTGEITEVTVEVSHFSVVAELLHNQNFETGNTGFAGWEPEASDTNTGAFTSPAVLIRVPSDSVVTYRVRETLTSAYLITATYSSNNWFYQVAWTASDVLAPRKVDSGYIDSTSETELTSQTFTCADAGDFEIEAFVYVVMRGTRTRTNEGGSPFEVEGRSARIEFPRFSTFATCRQLKDDYADEIESLGENVEALSTDNGSDSADLVDAGGKYGFTVQLQPGEEVETCALISNEIGGGAAVSAATSTAVTYFPKYPPGFDFFDTTPGCTVITNIDDEKTNTVLMVLEGSSVIDVTANVDFTPVELCGDSVCTASQFCNPGTETCMETPLGQGECELHPTTGTCGDTNAGKCILGLCIMEVIMDGSTTGNAVCQAEGLNCTAYPVFEPPQAACSAFHPLSPVTSGGSGERQGVYCDSNTGRACSSRVDTCHSCPHCNVTDVSRCSSLGTTLYESNFFNCTP